MLAYEPQIRVGAFLFVLGIVAVWELLFPKRPRIASKSIRWLNNLGLVALNAVVLRFLFPFLAIGVAIIAEEKGWGLLNQFNCPDALCIITGVIILDVLIYGQHVLFHKVSFLWRIHRMHHIDPDLDVTSGARFHPVEICLSMIIKMGAVIILGVQAETVIIFEVLLNVTAMFNHGNIRMPLAADSALRKLIVTPDMHRIHHSVYREETDSNFGFCLSWWDRIFKTYTPQPRDGHERMTIGTGQFLDAKYLNLHWLIAVPFLKSK